MSAVAIPNLWAGKISKSVLTPLVILRQQAVNLETESGTMLRAEVTSSIGNLGHKDEKKRRLTFLIHAPILRYTREVLVATHADQGAYPVAIQSTFGLLEFDEAIGEDVWVEKTSCENQERFIEVLGRIFGSEKLQSELESLIARINELS